MERFKESSGFVHDKVPENTWLNVKQHFWETYGGPWRYNQVIGWMRFYILGSQIRGELWLMVGKRFHRKSHNQIRWIGKVFEIHSFPDESSEQIFERIEQEFEELQNKWRRKGRVMDLECFRTLAPCIDWRKLVDMRDKKEL